MDLLKCSETHYFPGRALANSELNAKQAEKVETIFWNQLFQKLFGSWETRAHL